QRVKAPVRVHDDIDPDLGFIVAHAHRLSPFFLPARGGRPTAPSGAAPSAAAGRARAQQPPAGSGALNPHGEPGTTPRPRRGVPACWTCLMIRPLPPRDDEAERDQTCGLAASHGPASA